KNEGKANRQTLIHSLNVKSPLFESWIDHALKKKLIVQHGNNYQIHLSNPVINVLPATYITYPLITKTYKQGEQISRHYSPSQVKKAAEAAFGTTFGIRSS